jgi:predicted transcriptional regulator YheO
VVHSATDVVYSLETYTPIVSFLSEVLGDDSEVLLYDTRDPQHDAVVVASAGRRMGGEAEPALPASHADAAEAGDVALTTHATSSFRSRALTIRAAEGDSLGVLLVTTDLRPFLQVRDVVNTFIMPRPSSGAGEGRPGSAAVAGEELARMTIREQAEASALDPHLMSADERREFVGALERSGVFQVKGAAKEASVVLGVSESTVYRYLAQYRSDAEDRDRATG